MQSSARKMIFRPMVLLLVFCFLLTPLTPVLASEDTGDVPAQGLPSSSNSELIDDNPAETLPDAPDSDMPLSGDEEESGKIDFEPEALSIISPVGSLNGISDATETRLSPEVDNITGALVYRYPIIVPPGRNNMAPDIGLVYNSSKSANDSIVGSGWTLDIPYIQRVNKNGTNNFYSENYYASSMDGELVSLGSGNYGAKDETGQFRKYSLTSNVWTVTDKQGLVYKFGNTAAARQDNPSDNTKVYKWLLEETRDTNDNYMSYEYSKDAGQIYPSKIIYTGNGSTDGIFTVNFVRSSRAGVAASFDTGFSVKSNYRITEVRTEVDSVWARKYTFAYTTADNAAGSLLNTVIESGRDDSGSITTLPAVDFDYQTSASTTWTHSSSWTIDLPFINGGGDSGVRMADINGDGLLDILCHNDGTGSSGGVCPRSVPKIYLNNGTGWTDVSSTWLFPVMVDVPTKREAFLDSAFDDTGLRVLDLNGDGLADLVRKYGSSTSYIYLNNGSGWTHDSAWVMPLPLAGGVSNGTDSSVRMADINGDGLVDILCHTDNTTGTSPCNRTNPKIYLNNGLGWTDVSNTWLFPAMVDNPTKKEYILDDGFNDVGLRVYDVNGDGLADLVRGRNENSSSHFYTYLNTGSGWVHDSAWAIPIPFINIGKDSGARMTDVNGDGLLDILCHNDANVSGGWCNKPSPKVHLNNGSGWTDVSSTWSFPNKPGTSTKEFFLDSVFSDAGLRSVDVNGDGIDDLVRADSQYNTGTFYISNRDIQANLLTKVSYSTGGNTQIGYKATPKFRDGSTILNPNMPMVVDVVSQVINNNGSGLTETYDYSYEGGKYYFDNYLNRKFAGFNKVSKTDSAGNKIVNFYHQGNATDSTNGEYSDDISKVGQIYRSEVRSGTGSLYNLVINKWDKYDLGSSRSFVKKVRTTELSYDGDSDHKDKAEEYGYDNTYGNLTEKVEYGEITASNDGSFTDTGIDKFTTTISYAVNTTPYIVGLPSQETVIDQSSNKVRENKYYYDVQTLGDVTDGNLTKQEMWKTGSTYVYIEKTYNTTYGIVTQEKDPRGKTTSYSYDTYNLYPITVTNALTQSTNYTHDYSSGKVKTKTDSNSRVFEWIYDGLDRVKTEKQPDLASPSTLVTKTAYTYTDTANAVKVQQTDYLDTSTAVDTYTFYDGLGRSIQVRKEMEDSNTFSVTDTIYNNIGQVHKESLPYSSTGGANTSPTTTTDLLLTKSYDPMLRVTSIVNATGTTSNAYDDWKLTITDPRNKVRHLYKDAYGNLVRVDEINGGDTYTTTYEYDGNNNLTKITDALSHIRNFTYDGLSRRLTAQDLHASGDATFGTWTYTYDDSGNITSIVDPKSQTINHTYDDINRVSTEDYTGQGGTEVTYSYDSGTNGIGRLTSVTTPGLNTSYLYNPLGLVKQEVKTIDSVTYQTDYTHDRQGNLLEITNPDSSKVKYTYNTAGQLETVQRKESTDGSFINIITDFNYGPHGKIIYQAYENGLATTNTYDAGKLYRLSNKQTASITFSSSSNNNPTISLTGSNFFELALNASWSDPGFSATDSEDGDLTSAVIVTGSVNTAVAGTYQLVYSVVDSEGAPAASKIRTVVVWPSMTVRALVVAGGGGGGKSTSSGIGGGGGGAGGMQDASGVNLSEQAYTITVGTGGTGSTSNSMRGGNGGNSSFGSLVVSTGGGGGGSSASGFRSGSNGGSGGGSWDGDTAGTGTSSQGNNGGSGGDSGGGGGAGATGTGGTSTSGGNGGIGLPSSITGTSITYAAGGGGGSNSTAGTPNGGGGGGNGGSGATNRGNGGGGGGPTSGNGGNGGSGIAVIRYKTDGSEGVSSSSTGGTITSSGGYTIHTFNSGGMFTAVSPLNSSNQNPVITLTGSDLIELTLNDIWTDPGYSASDAEDGSLTSSVTINGSLNTSIAGTYQLIYSVLDSKGEPAARKIRTVVVHTPVYLQNISYAYDANGNVTQIVEAADVSSARTVDYTYDDLNRLSSATATNVASGQSAYTHSYTYNAIGNILTRTDAAGTYTYAGDQASNYANPHAVTSVGSINYTYDNNGNLLTETGGLSNLWDYNNRLTQATKGGVVSTYTYDHNGQRVKLGNGTATTYYPTDHYSTDGSTATKHITTPDGQLLATVEGTGVLVDVYSLHTDHLSGSSIVSNISGASEQEFDYYPFGNVRINQLSGTFRAVRQFTGHEYDIDTGLNHMKARYQKSDLGRFISQDPMYLAVGSSVFTKKWNNNWRHVKSNETHDAYYHQNDRLGKDREDRAALREYLYNPQYLNSYSYVSNNPLKYTDPTGEWEFHINFLESNIGLGGEVGNSWTIGFASDGTFGISTSLHGGGLAGVDASMGISGGYSNAQTWGDTLGTGQYASVGGKVLVGGSLTTNFSDGKYTGTDVGVGLGARGVPPVPVAFSGGVNKTVPVYQGSVSGIKNSITNTANKTVNTTVSTVKQGWQKTTNFFKKLW